MSLLRRPNEGKDKKGSKEQSKWKKDDNYFHRDLNFFVPTIVEIRTVKELRGIMMAATKGLMNPLKTAATESEL